MMLLNQNVITKIMKTISLANLRAESPLAMARDGVRLGLDPPVQDDIHTFSRGIDPKAQQSGGEETPQDQTDLVHL
jgi:hypothetical protein